MWFGKTAHWDYTEDLRVHGRIILKRILRV
jgi:hypothetical protein